MTSNAGVVLSQHCDGCGHMMNKAHRRHKGQRYCATCYARMFKRRICPSCGSFARLPPDDDATCRKCDSARPCVRCGERGRRVGLMTEYGPVCSACRPHFISPKPCGECGKPSNRLSRVSRLGLQVQVCPACARSDFATCQACRRHRLLARAEDGRMLCKACLTIGTVSCPVCGGQMPAGRRNACEPCYWRRVHLRRVKLDQSAFESSRFAALFADFAAWLQCHAGGHRAALTVHRYLPFFTEIEKRWSEIPAYPDLLKYFGAEGLRRVRLPMKWLGESHQMTVDAVAREAVSEGRRVATIISTVPAGTVGAIALSAYKSKLQEKSRLANQRHVLCDWRCAQLRVCSLLQMLSGIHCLTKPSWTDFCARCLVNWRR